MPGAVAGTGRAHQSAPDHHGQAERRIKPDQIHVANVENVKMIRNLHSLLSNSFLILSASLCCTLTSGFVAVIEVLQTSFDTRIGRFGKTLLHLGDIRTNSVATSLAAWQIQAAHEAVGLGVALTGCGTTCAMKHYIESPF